jgi:hypothetical protein
MSKKRKILSTAVPRVAGLEHDEDDGANERHSTTAAVHTLEIGEMAVKAAERALAAGIVATKPYAARRLAYAIEQAVESIGHALADDRFLAPDDVKGELTKFVEKGRALAAQLRGRATPPTGTPS